MCLGGYADVQVIGDGVWCDGGVWICIQLRSFNHVNQ